MKPSRNDPCPCGSGKKYKACCQAREQTRAHTRRLIGEEAFDRGAAAWQAEARRQPFWEADVIPVFGTFRDDPSPLSVSIVTAGGFAPYLEVLSVRPATAQERAREVLRGVMAAGRELGLLPGRLHVRDEAVADALRAELAQRGMEVQAAPLPELDRAVDDTVENVVGPNQARITRPDTWRETGATPGEIAALHAAAAAFYRAAPWDPFAEAPIGLEWPDGGRWWAVAMGAAGMEYGLALYADRADLQTVIDSDPDEEVGEILKRQKDVSLTLDFQPRRDLSAAMRREVAAAGWEVAAAEAYPEVTAMRLPERRLTPRHVRLVTDALRAVAAAADAALEGDPGERWTDPATGITLALPDLGSLFEDDLDDEYDGYEEEEPGELPWPAPERAHAITAEGPGAEPATAVRGDPEWVMSLRAEEGARLRRFQRWLDAQRLSRAARERWGRTAQEWVTCLVDDEVISCGAATEYDLRFFLYHWLPRQAPVTVLRKAPECVRVLCGWLEEHEGIRYPFAGRVLEELERLAREHGGKLDELLSRGLHG